MPLPFQPWRDALLPASFGGAEFHVETGSQASGRRIALHEYPKQDVPFAEDMGRRARRWTIAGYCIGPFYLDDRDALIEVCETEGPYTLVHPSLGEMQVVCDGYSVNESREKGGFCVFEMQFIEAGADPDSGISDDTPAQVNNAANAAGPTMAAAGDAGLSGSGGGVGGINAGAGSGDFVGSGGGVAGINAGAGSGDLVQGGVGGIGRS